MQPIHAHVQVQTPTHHHHPPTHPTPTRPKRNRQDTCRCTHLVLFVQGAAWDGYRIAQNFPGGLHEGRVDLRARTHTDTQAEKGNRATNNRQPVGEVGAHLHSAVTERDRMGCIAMQQLIGLCTSSLPPCESWHASARHFGRWTERPQSRPPDVEEMGHTSIEGAVAGAH